MLLKILAIIAICSYLVIASGILIDMIKNFKKDPNKLEKLLLILI